MVAYWERMPWPQRRGAPGGHLFLEFFGTAPCCLNAFIHVTGKAPALRVEGASLLLFLSPPLSAAPPFL